MTTIQKLQQIYLIEPREFADLLGCSEPTVKRWEEKCPQKVEFLAEVLIDYQLQYFLLWGEYLKAPQTKVSGVFIKMRKSLDMTQVDMYRAMRVCRDTIERYDRDILPSYIDNLSYLIVDIHEEIKTCL